jgi:hypothetical protein
MSKIYVEIEIREKDVVVNGLNYHIGAKGDCVETALVNLANIMEAFYVAGYPMPRRECGVVDELGCPVCGYGNPAAT